MRLSFGFFATIAVLAGTMEPALAQTNGWYVGGETGVNFVPHLSFQEADSTWSEKHDEGNAVFAQVGYGFGPIRLEGEAGWRDNDVKHFSGTRTVFNTGNGNYRFGGTPQPSTVGIGDGEGDTGALEAMTNVYYDISTGTSFTPYLGLGIGGAQVRPDIVSDSGVTVGANNGFAFAYQALIGASYAITNNLSIKADYRNFRTANATVKETTPNGVATAHGSYEAQGIFVGLTYKLDAPQE